MLELFAILYKIFKVQKVDLLKSHLKRGEVYRRQDLMRWSTSVDRHLEELVADGTIQKLSGGMYYYPEKTAFGMAPAKEEVLVKGFLKDDRFLLTSPNLYNSLGLGTTQLYNTRVVYNHKRSGEFTFGNRKFLFRKKPHFPKTLTTEFLLVDLVDNLGSLAEDQAEVLNRLPRKVSSMDRKKLARAVSQYGSSKAKKILGPLTQHQTTVYGTGVPA